MSEPTTQRGDGIVLDHVGKRYGDGATAVIALDNVSLTMRAGEFVAIMGPSGSGKSTLLNLIAGLDVPSHGRVVVGSADLAVLSEDQRSDLRLRRIGFVFQSFNLFPTFSAEENVAWPLEFLGVGWRDACARASAALQQVGVTGAACARRPAELSGGEQQRVAIARALVTRPGFLLADEPTGNLDSKTGEEILRLLAALNARDGVTIVLVTHSTAAATHARRTIELRDGRIVP